MNEYQPCIIERSWINGNFELWLPEQEGLIEWIETKYEGSQAHLWHVLIYAASEQKGLDISSLYIEPEGDVFVAYAPDDRVLIHVASVISELISHKTLMLKTAEYAEEKNLWNKFHCARR